MLTTALLTGCHLRSKNATADKAWHNDPVVSVIEEAYQSEADTLYRQGFMVHFVIAGPQEKIYGLYNPMSNQFFSTDRPFIVKIVDPFLFISGDDGKTWLPITNDGYWVSRFAVERAYIINPRQRDYGILTYSSQTWQLRLSDDSGALHRTHDVPKALISAVEGLEACDTLSFVL